MDGAIRILCADMNEYSEMVSQNLAWIKFGEAILQHFDYKLSGFRLASLLSSFLWPHKEKESLKKGIV